MMMMDGGSARFALLLGSRSIVMVIPPESPRHPSAVLKTNFPVPVSLLVDAPSNTRRASHLNDVPAVFGMRKCLIKAPSRHAGGKDALGKGSSQLTRADVTRVPRSSSRSRRSSM